MCPKCNEEFMTTPLKKKKCFKIAIVIGGISVAAVIVLMIAIALLSGDDKNDYALYLKDEEVFFADLDKESEPWQVTSQLCKDREVDGVYDASSVVVSAMTFSCVSNDGKYIFFPDEMDDETRGWELYYKRVDKPHKEAIKIDSKMLMYFVNDSATVVTYGKGMEYSAYQKLYQYNIRKDSKEKIAEDVAEFWVSKDGKNIIYRNSEGTLYLQKVGKEKEKIAGDVSYIVRIDEEFKTVYYEKEGFLYKQVLGEDKVRIASNVERVLKIYESGEIYYLKSEFKEISLMDYVEDDMLDTDSYITKPVYPTFPDCPSYPFRYNYDTVAEYEEALTVYEEAYAAYEAECERLDKEYQNAYEIYWEKEYRDELRMELETITMKETAYSLWYYDGTEEICVADNFSLDSDYSYRVYHDMAVETPVITYETYNQSDVEKVKLSEIENVYTVEDMIKDKLFSSTEKYIAVKDVVTIVEQKKEACNFRINNSGTVVYYIDDVSEEQDCGDIYRISISDGIVGTPEVYDSDVNTQNFQFVSDSEIVYFKHCENQEGELYINKNRIDCDVSVFNIWLNDYANTGKLYYVTDGDKKILKVYDGQESVKIEDEIYSYIITPDGRVLYLYNYNINKNSGELYEWSNGKSRMIDDDVFRLISVMDPLAKRFYR